MAGLNIADLPLPSKEFRLDLMAQSGLKRFETEEEARSEDRKRIELLSRAADLATRPKNRKAANGLAEKLNYELGTPPATISSCFYMRSQRVRIGGALLQLADQFSAEECVTFHLTPRNLDVRGEELANFDPRKACAALLGDFNRHGISDADGGLNRAGFAGGRWM